MTRVAGTAERVRLQVLQGRLQPGELLVEALLAQELHVPRSTLREALRHLEGRGLLGANASGGMRVPRLDAPALVAVLEARAALEPVAAAAAAGQRRAGRLEADDLRELAALADAEGPPGWDALARERTFHVALTRRCDNPPVQDALDRFWDQLLVAGHQSGAWATRLARPSSERSALAAAIAAGDPETAAGLAGASSAAALARWRG